MVYLSLIKSLSLLRCFNHLHPAVTVNNDLILESFPGGIPGTDYSGFKERDVRELRAMEILKYTNRA